VEHCPVPETTTGRSIRIEAGDGEAFGLGGETAPAQLRGAIFTTCSHDAAALWHRQGLAIGDVIALQSETGNGGQEIVGVGRLGLGLAHYSSCSSDGIS